MPGLKLIHVSKWAPGITLTPNTRKSIIWNYDVLVLRRIYSSLGLNDYPDSKVHGTNMGSSWGRQDPGGSHVGPINFGIWIIPLEENVYNYTGITGFKTVAAHEFSVALPDNQKPRYWICISDRSLSHDDVTKWSHFPCYWPFVKGIHRLRVGSPHKGQSNGALMLFVICAWTNAWANNLYAYELRRLGTHYDINVMCQMSNKSITIGENIIAIIFMNYLNNWNQQYSSSSSSHCLMCVLEMKCSYFDPFLWRLITDPCFSFNVG